MKKREEGHGDARPRTGLASCVCCKRYVIAAYFMRICWQCWERKCRVYHIRQRHRRECLRFAVPAGTLIGVTVEVMDDANGSAGTNSQITWTWTYLGEPLAPTPGGTFSEQGNGSGGFGVCAGTGTLSCDASANFSTIATYTGGQ